MINEETIKRLYTFIDGQLISNKTGKPIGVPDKRGKNVYLCVKVNQKREYVHRILFFFYHGYWPDLIDHDDNNGLNNTRANLIDRNHNQNLIKAPLRVDNTSGYKGINWHKKAKKWQVKISYKGVNYYLGLYSDLEEAVKVRKDTENKFLNPLTTLFGEA